VPPFRDGKRVKRITCKACGEKVRVPRQLSRSSVQKVLVSAGIDPAAALQAYEDERSREHEREESSRARVYRCTRCGLDMIGSSDLRGAYVKGELVCSGCRAVDEIVDKRASEREPRRLTPSAKAKTRRRRGDERRLAVSVGYGVLFFLGTAAPLAVLSPIPAVLAGLVGGAIALAGGMYVYRIQT
jgi:transcription elongation factor Elf1